MGLLESLMSMDHGEVMGGVGKSTVAISHVQFKLTLS